YMSENPGSKYYKLASQKIKELNEIYKLIDELEKAFSQEDIARIAFSLASCDNPASVPPLIKLLQSDDEFRSLIGALALGHMARKEVIFDLLELAKSADAGHRKYAAWILGRTQVKNKRITDTLLGLLNDADSEVRMYAAWALGRLQIKGATKPLQALAKRSPDAADSKEAAKAIDAINNKFYNPKVKGQPPWLLVPEKDIPFSVAHTGSILTLNITGSAEMWGFIFKKSDSVLPLKVSRWKSAVIYWGGKGEIEDKWLWKTVELAGKYYPNVDLL
ncbi:MAG TPA: HEAT repeat domain-containing protein, partial [Proteobacteria bacterium]|nr:HEAT repeat domain-containing protein [Pseudomonadota bacterium]